MSERSSPKKEYFDSIIASHERPEVDLDECLS